jgi:hypothetical protein
LALADVILIAREVRSGQETPVEIARTAPKPVKHDGILHEADLDLRAGELAIGGSLGIRDANDGAFFGLVELGHE